MTGGTLFRNGGGVTAKMAAQPRGGAMEGERDTAIRAAACFTAIAAQQRSGKTSAIEKQNGLLALLEPISDGGAQFVGQNGEAFLFSPFDAEIDDANERHLTVVDALGQTNELIFPAGGIEVTFQRRRGGTENDDTFLDFGPDDGDVASMVTRCFFLLVGILVLFIDHDQSKICQRREYRAPRADDDAGASGMNFVPLVMPLTLR